MKDIEKNKDSIKKRGSKNYQEICKSFSWPSLANHQGEHNEKIGLNIGYESIDRNVDRGIGGKIAIRWCSKAGLVKDYTYKDLQQQTNKFANVLAKLGLEKGDCFYGLSPRLPELYIAVIGALKHRCIFSPLFSAFGPEPIRARIEMGHGKLLLTTEALFKRKVAKILDELENLEHVIIIDGAKDNLPKDPRIHCLSDLMETADVKYQIGYTDKEDPALLHFTSGTTGKPKGAQHVHEAVLYHRFSGQMALDLQEDDVFWCTADPGWVTGTSYGIIAPLSNGVTMIIDEGEFDADRWYQIIQDQKVNVWYTAPTAVRMMMKIGADLTQQYDLSSLRFIASVGEPLNPEAIRWSLDAFRMPIHDNWWQSETGGIMIANYASETIKPGSMGQVMPGIQAAILVEEEGTYHEAKAGEEGQLAIKTPWPSMFRGYLNQEERYQKCFTSDGWYLSGDLAKKDPDGYFWFVGRADDVIKSAGHLIGPFEVESALIEHPAVAEAAVIGIPDKLMMETVKAYVTLNPDHEISDAMRKDIFAFARKKLGPAVAPRELELVTSLPKTRSGKIMRRLLKARELGLPEGDTSTLEADPTVIHSGDK